MGRLAAFHAVSARCVSCLRVAALTSLSCCLSLLELAAMTSSLSLLIESVLVFCNALLSTLALAAAIDTGLSRGCTGSVYMSSNSVSSKSQVFTPLLFGLDLGLISVTLSLPDALASSTASFLLALATKPSPVNKVSGASSE